MEPFFGPTTAAALAALVGRQSAPAKRQRVADKGQSKAKKSAAPTATVADLLSHYPRRYQERGELTVLRELSEGDLVTVLVRVERVDQRRMRQRRGTLTEVVVTDGTDRLLLTWFNQPWHARRLLPGRVGLFSGKVREYRGKRQLANAEYQLLADDASVALAAEDGSVSIPDHADGGPDAETLVPDFAGAVIPVYPASAALPTWRIARCIGTVLDWLAQGTAMDDLLPADLREEFGFATLHEAFEGVHRPQSVAQAEQARDRLRFDEAFVVQTALAVRRADVAQRVAVPRVERTDGLLAAFDQSLPFALTAGQQAVAGEIAHDMSLSHPMHRLLQGEVGSGKTVVALRAMLTAVDNGGQAVLLAPTEVLAQQHHRSITALLGPLAQRDQLGGSPLGTEVALLTGTITGSRRREVLQGIASGRAGVVIGTHALLYEREALADVALVVIDEQHRFGVEQRAALIERDGCVPHVLVMTATPIPRTIAMTVFGDLETSTLAELPRNRQPIACHVVPATEKPHYLERAWQRLVDEARAGHQSFVVCPRAHADDGKEGAADGEGQTPLTDDETPWDDADGSTTSHTADLTSVDELFEVLVDGPLSSLRVEKLYRQMPNDHKDAIMTAFVAGHIDVLVATTVVEVGVDVPNATAMVVMDADRFGVSQLHQLRGRVGRGRDAGVCLLVTNTEQGSPARERVEEVARTSDGFALAQVDLAYRREGDVLGAVQSGRRSSLRLLSVITDGAVIEQARTAAVNLVSKDPTLVDHATLARAVQRLEAEGSADYLDKA